MALLDRCRERVETDLSDAELQRLIDDANSEIILRFGPHADAARPISITIRGQARYLDLARPLDTLQVVAIIESTQWWESDWEWWTFGGEDSVTLGPTDYRVLNAGRTLERLASGVHPRVGWGRTVQITYTPVSDGNQRQEAIIKLVQLAVQYDGTSNLKVGDYSQANLSYQGERDRILQGLAARKGFLLR
jgi:hypothetical protein